MLLRVLLATDSPKVDQLLRETLRGQDVILETVSPGPGHWNRITAEPADVLIVSRSLIPSPAPESIRTLRDTPESTQVIVLADREDPEDRARLVTAGCETVVPGTLSGKLMEGLLGEVLQRRRDWLAPQLDRSRDRMEPRLSDFVTSSPAMQTFMEVVRRVTPSNTSLLIQGETGVGKERLARAIHAESRRQDGPFLAVNCGALPESLLESELFGHTEGAFTGATRARRGWFELAHGGTLLLDEIGDVPLHVQVKLLRALQEHEIQPIGSEKPIRVDVRVIAATNRDLEGEVAAGRFRSDLFYRLGVVTLKLPPLRERREDIAALARSYFEYYREILGRDLTGIEKTALAALKAHHWPGNVRELMNVMERAVLLSDGPLLRRSDLPADLTIGGAPALAPGGLAGGRLFEDLSERPWNEVRRYGLLDLERAYLTTLLRDTGGRIGETAKRAGIRPRSLYDKMKRLGLRKEDFR